MSPLSPRPRLLLPHLVARTACSLVMPDAEEPHANVEASGHAVTRGRPTTCLEKGGVALRVFGIEEESAFESSRETVVVCPGLRAGAVSAWLRQLLPQARILIATEGKERPTRVEREAIAVDPDDEVASSPLSLATALASLAKSRAAAR